MLNIVIHREPLVKHYEPLAKHHETLLKHCETSWNTRTLVIRCDNIGARCGDVGAQWGDVGARRGDRAEPNVAGRKWAQIYIYIYKTLLKDTAYFGAPHAASWHRRGHAKCRQCVTLGNIMKRSPLRHRSDVPNPPTISRCCEQLNDIQQSPIPPSIINLTLRPTCAIEPVLHTIPPLNRRPAPKPGITLGAIEQNV